MWISTCFNITWNTIIFNNKVVCLVINLYKQNKRMSNKNKKKNASSFSSSTTAFHASNDNLMPRSFGGYSFSLFHKYIF